MQHLRDAVQHGGDRERLVTDEVLASFDDTPDPRTREILRVARRPPARVRHARSS